MSTPRTTRRARSTADPLPDEASITVESTVTPEETPEAKQERERVEGLLAKSRKQLRTSISAWQFYKDQAKEDMRFRAGEWGNKSFQWPEGVQEQRRAEERPCVTINRAPSFIRQVTNAARLARLRITVVPVDSNSDPATAETFQGLIRQIETASFADRAYNMASEKQAEQGLGFINLVTEWANEKDCKIRIRIEREVNPLSIYVDPACKRADFSDANYAHQIVHLDRETYKELYGEDAPNADTLDSLGMDDEQVGDWFPNGKVTVARWVYKERGERKRIAELSSGKIINFPTEEQRKTLATLKEYVVRDRYVQPFKMVIRVHSATKIHEESAWAADCIPFVPVVGDELWIDGERDFRGVIRDSKGSGQAYNVQVSALLEGVGKANKTTVIGGVGQFGAPNSPQRKSWEMANRKNFAFLEFTPQDIAGKLLGRPEPANYQPDLRNNIMALEQTDNDYKITAGFNDASLGERGPQESGKAIKLRQDQDTLGSSHYLDNLRFALASAGRQLIQLIRAHYDVAQVVRITGADNTPVKVLIFSGKENDPRQQQGFQLPEGVDRIHDLEIGEFDIEVNSGPQHGTRRQEIAEQLGTLLGSIDPTIAVNYFDLYFKVLDIPESAQMSARAKKMLPKELQDPEEGQAQIPPEVQQKMAQLEQQLEQLNQIAQQQQQMIETEQVKIKGQMLMKQEEIASKERIEHAKAQLAIIQQQGDIKAEQALALLQGEIDRQLLAAEASFKASLLKLEHVQDLETAEVQQNHALEQTDAALGGKVVEGQIVHRQKTEQLGVQHRQKLIEGQVEHHQALEAGDRTHQQNLEAGDQTHKHDIHKTVVAAKLAPKPAAAAKKPGKDTPKKK